MLTHTMAKFRRMPRRVCRTVWETMPASVAQTPIMNKTGRFIYRRFTRDTVKVQTHFTHFMRNPPLLDALTQLTGRMETGEPLRIASIGCSTGAELYSVLYTLRKAYPGKEIFGYGSDLSEEVVKVAQLGRYQPGRAAGEGGMFHAGRPEVEASEVAEFSGLMEPGRDGVCEVHDWLKAGTSWFVADAIKDDIVAMIGPQDVVLANNFMGPMDDLSADQCLRNVMGLVRPGGILVIDGVDLDVKTRTIRGSRFTPVLINQDAIWTSDESKQGWPWLRWAAEPIDRSEPDWRVRYTIIFQRSH